MWSCCPGHGFLQRPAPLLWNEPVDDLFLGWQMDSGIVSSVVKPETFLEIVPCVDGQQIQLQQKFRQTVLDDTEQVVQLSVQIVVDFEFVRRLSQQHRTAAAEDFNVTVVFQREYRVDDRQQVCLVADTG